MTDRQQHRASKPSPTESSGSIAIDAGTEDEP
jgi:hypothetical protein